MERSAVLREHRSMRFEDVYGRHEQGRLRIGDAALTAWIRDPRTAVYVLYDAGVPAGFSELFRHDEATTELVHFALMPEFFGRALGPWFLDEILAIAWKGGPQRVALETCSLDHPKALALYQRAGFVPYRRERAFRADPRAEGLIPPGAGRPAGAADGPPES